MAEAVKGGKGKSRKGGGKEGIKKRTGKERITKIGSSSREVKRIKKGRDEKKDYFFLPNPSQFLGLSHSYEESYFVIIPVRFGKHSTWGKGSEKAPSRIIEVSYHLEDFETETKINMAELGIHTIRGVDKLEEIPYVIESVIKDGKFPVVIGGEHTITHKVLEGAKNALGELSAIFLDAHADLFPEYNGDKLSHACAAYLSLQFASKIYILGVRNIAIQELDVANKNKDKVKIKFIEEMLKGDFDIPDIEGKVWLSFDYDFVDPSVIPTVSTPEPPGFRFFETTELLRKISTKIDIVGADFVEFIPEGVRYSDITSAKLIAKLIAFISTSPFHREKLLRR